jgi:DNA-binding transcriptional LysR family regulator
VPDLKDLECLVALARQRHFARAARDCALSQPAFSMRIRNLEERLNTSIVKRGNRFQGLTVEGETVVAHARLILEQIKALENEVKRAGGQVVGTLVLGVIPTASAQAARLAKRLATAHPEVRVRIEMTNSLAIQQGVLDGVFDAGITYTEGVDADLLRVEPLYDERYVLLAPVGMVPAGARTIRWSEAATLPLTLLEPSMQNRRIVDRVFEDVGVQPRVTQESNGFIAAMVMAIEGLAATVVPEVMLDALGPVQGTVALPLVDPLVEKSVSLVTPARSRRVPLVEALRTVLGKAAR